MKNELAVAIVFAIIGFFIGGIYGAVWDGGWHPDCWIGALIGLIAGFGGCVCGIHDIFD